MTQLAHAQPVSANVLLLRDLDLDALSRLLARYTMELIQVAPGGEIPGSFWGESEAGLVGNRVCVRPDTPVHSVLHEACHFICMDAPRRAGLDRDAGGDYEEENAVCYLQITLADELPGMNRQRMCADMDGWGYTFRLGSAHAWFDQDAQDAVAWLQACGVLDSQRQPTWQVRECAQASSSAPALPGARTT